MVTTKAHCNQCQGETNHSVLRKVHTSWSADYPNEEIEGWDSYEMLQCKGCNRVCLRHCSYYSEDDDQPSVIYYPPAVARREPKWLSQVAGPFGNADDAIGELVCEIYTALHNGSRRLAAIGVRSLLEYVMLSKVSDHGTFNKNVSAFRNAGFLSEKHALFLSTAIEAGHASTHRSWKPTREELNTIMDITESILEAVYVLHPSAEKLASGIPARKKG